MDSIDQNRRRFITALRLNPLGLVQHHDSTLFNEKKGTVCALGVGCAEFGINMSTSMQGDDFPDPYNLIRKVLGIDAGTLSLMWKWNDTCYMTFGQIANRLEELWFPAIVKIGELTEIR